LIGAVQRLHDFLKGEDYVDAVLLIQPVVFEGQAHTIQQYAIQHLGISGQIFELGVRKKRFRNPIECKLFRLYAIEVIVLHLMSSTKKGAV